MYDACSPMCVQMAPPQNADANRTPSEAVHGTISRMAVISSPAPIRRNCPSRPAFRRLSRTSAGAVPVSLPRLAKIIKAAINTCSTRPPILNQFLELLTGSLPFLSSGDFLMHRGFGAHPEHARGDLRLVLSSVEVNDDILRLEPDLGQFDVGIVGSPIAGGGQDRRTVTHLRQAQNRVVLLGLEAFHGAGVDAKHGRGAQKEAQRDVKLL